MIGSTPDGVLPEPLDCGTCADCCQRAFCRQTDHLAYLLVRHRRCGNPAI